MSTATVTCADALHLPLPDGSVDLIVTSPPYENARMYEELNFDLSGDEWIEWAVPRFIECLRVCKGLVAWVINGRTKDHRYSCIPERLTAALHARGVHLRHPIVYQRYGIPGGAPDWPRNIWETVICATNGGPLPWCDIKAMGHAPKYPRGGALSHRGEHDARVNHGRSVEVERTKAVDLIECGAVGGGNIGSALAHKAEAPFPEKLVEWFVRTYCPEGRVVCDPMCGGGTTLAVALKHGREAIGYDIRESQVDLSRRRIAEAAESAGLFCQRVE